MEVLKYSKCSLTYKLEALHNKAKMKAGEDLVIYGASGPRQFLFCRKLRFPFRVQFQTNFTACAYSFSISSASTSFTEVARS
jgi:hypothetical protein